MTELDLCFFDEIKYEAYIGGFWISLTSDVRDSPSPSFNNGILSSGPTDRIGDIEIFSFHLRNDAGNSAGLLGYYTPGHPNAMSGWTTGIKIRLIFVMDGVEKVKWIGTIDPDGITVSPGARETRTVSVLCSGFMAKASSHRLRLMELQEDITIDEAVPSVLANMPVQPEATLLYPGISVFPFAFDTLDATTRALGELQKLAMSELSYIYTISDGTLVVEARDTRTSQTEDTVFPTPNALCGFLLKEDGEELLMEDGGEILIEGTSSGDFTLMSLRPGAPSSYGRDVYNYVPAITYPRRVDAAATTVLFKLQSPIEVKAGQTVTGVRGNYRDPAGGASYVNGKDMVTPAAGTHFSFRTNQDGSGSNRDADLTISGDPGLVAGRPNYGTEAVEYTFTNTSGTDGWVTFLEAVGRGIYLYDAVELIAEDQDSQDTFGVQEIRIEMKYQSDPSVGAAYSRYVLSQSKRAKMKLDKFPMFANYDPGSLAAFFHLEPGSRATFSEEMAGISGHYFIMGYDAKIVSGKYVFWTPILKNADRSAGWIIGTSMLGTDTILATEEFG